MHTAYHDPDSNWRVYHCITCRRMEIRVGDSFRLYVNDNWTPDPLKNHAAQALEHAAAVADDDHLLDVTDASEDEELAIMKVRNNVPADFVEICRDIARVLHRTT